MVVKLLRPPVRCDKFVFGVAITSGNVDSARWWWCPVSLALPKRPVSDYPNQRSDAKLFRFLCLPDALGFTWMRCNFDVPVQQLGGPPLALHAVG